LAFSPDGRILATGGGSRIVLWDPHTGKEKGQIQVGEPGTWFDCLAFSPDSKTLALGRSANDQLAILIWNNAERRIVRKLKVPEGYVLTIAFSPDGGILAGGASCGKVYLWDTSTGKELHRLEREKPTVIAGYSIAFSPDGKAVAAGGATVATWDVGSGRRLSLSETEAIHVAFSQDSKTLIGAGRWHPPQPSTRYPTFHPAIFYWNRKTGKERRLVLERIQGPFLNLAVSPDGRTFATAGPDWRVRLWETASGKERCFLQGREAHHFSLAFSPDGRTLATGWGDGLIRLWRVGDPGLKEAAQRCRPSSNDLVAQWTDLASADAAHVYRTICTLVDSPKETIPFLKEHLRELPQADPRKITGLVMGLDSNRFEERQKAADELEKLGRQAQGALERFLAGQPSLEARRRTEGLLDKIDFPITSPERLRVIRSVEVLEKIGNAEAKRLLQTLAQGIPGAELTEEAKAALARLTERPATRP
jgi:WD40 repeat protein